MSITMIRGYGLPSDAASSYNGYAGGPVRGAVVNVPSVALPTGRWQQPYPPVASYQASLFRTTPDPQLGGFGDLGFGTMSVGPAAFVAAGVSTSTQQMGNPGGFGGLDMTTVAIGLGVAGLALYFLTKKG